MQDLIKELQEVGLTPEQIKKTFTSICKWTNRNHPVMGAVIETMLWKNHLIDYPDCKTYPGNHEA